MAATGARLTLAGIRLANGSVGLLAPQVLARRLGADPEASPELLYALRMFGVRTVAIAIDLIRDDPAAVRQAVPIHASDTVAALILARRLPRRGGALVVGISAANTILALAAYRGARR